MSTCIRIITLVPLLLLAGCNFVAGGGGGSVHSPPEVIDYDRVTPLRLELSVNEGSAKRYTDVRCHYKTEKARSFTALQGRVEGEASNRMFIVFDLPPLSAADGTYVEYYFDMKLDGHYNKRDVVRVPLR
jgi:hypothetical protein